MVLFWDTSAILALVVAEPHSAEALQAASQAAESYGWRWLRVEAAAGLARRRATEEQWRRLEGVLAALWDVDIPPARFAEVAAANREWRLRAADAGHLFCFRQLTAVFPGIQMVCFDAEIRAAAESARLPLWSPPGEG
jgi:uncharacterized protein with PIN domain